MVKSRLEPQLKLSKLFMILDHPTYGSHQAHAHLSLVYYTPDSSPQNLHPMKRTELLLILLMDLDPLTESVDLILLELLDLPSEPHSEKSPKNPEFLSLLLDSMES